MKALYEFTVNNKYKMLYKPPKGLSLRRLRPQITKAARDLFGKERAYVNDAYVVGFRGGIHFGSFFVFVGVITPTIYSHNHTN